MWNSMLIIINYNFSYLFATNYTLSFTRININQEAQAAISSPNRGWKIPLSLQGQYWNPTISYVKAKIFNHNNQEIPLYPNKFQFYFNSLNDTWLLFASHLQEKWCYYTFFLLNVDFMQFQVIHFPLLCVK